MKIMTKEEAFNFLKGKKTMVINEEQSREVQEKLFQAGFKWAFGGAKVKCTDALFLFTDDEDGIITLSCTARTFDESEKEFILPFDILGIEIVEKKPKFSYKQEVLVRDGDEEEWAPAVFAYKSNQEHYPYVIFGGEHYNQCIALAGNERLMGTTDNP